MRFDIRSQDPADLAAAFATLQIAPQEGVRITITMERNPHHRETMGTLNALAAEAKMPPLPRGKLISQPQARAFSVAD